MDNSVTVGTAKTVHVLQEPSDATAKVRLRRVRKTAAVGARHRAVRADSSVYREVARYVTVNRVRPDATAMVCKRANPTAKGS